MSEVLSQNEIDALLAAVSSGNIETTQRETPSAKQGDYIAYDLASQEKIFHGRLVGLQGIHERLARNLRMSLSQFLGKNVVVTCANTEYMKFSDYVVNVLRPVAFGILHTEDPSGSMLITMSSKLTYAIVDSYFGGSERPFAKIGEPREEFTAIERKMIEKVQRIACDDLMDAWKLNYPLKATMQGYESNPAFVGALSAGDIVAVVTFEVELEALSGPLILVVQLRSLDPVQQYLAFNVTSETSPAELDWRKHWLNELRQTALEVRVELGTAQRSLHEIQQFKEGDVLVLSQDAAAPLPVMLEGLPKCKGMMGTYRGNVAMRLIADLK